MRNQFAKSLVLCALAVSTASAGAQASGFCDKVKALTTDPTVAAAHWGVSVTTLDGTVLCAVNEAQLFRPASNNKLFTAAAALALMGPEKRFTTTVVGDGELVDGVLKGNLKLVGGGDANFGSHEVPYVEPTKPATPAAPEPATIADIEELADQVVARGVKSITGDVVGDDSFFAWEPYPAGWGIDDLQPGYGAPVSALTIHDSLIEIDVAPGPKVGATQVDMRPDVPYYLLADETTTIAKATTPTRARIHVDRGVGSREVRVTGEIPLDAPMVKMELAIQDPAEYAALALKDALERRGVKVAGTASALHGIPTGSISAVSPDDALATVKKQLAAPATNTCGTLAASVAHTGTALASHVSPQLADDVMFTMKDSQNLHAEILMRNLGVAFACDYRGSGGLAIVKAFAAQAGISPADLVLYDGSGLSGHDLVTPRSLTQLLVYAMKQKWGETLKASLPVGGVDGTLANRFLAPGSTLAGKVFAKTGTLGESRDLSGYLTAASGATVVFSVLVDNHPPTGGADRVAMDKIVEAIVAGN
jgi:D-alanyl-D-alanine carboxypeptidase/D-alanyl-D-alanine-endopeptidase (penicillin-binding protein 4)